MGFQLIGCFWQLETTLPPFITRATKSLWYLGYLFASDSLDRQVDHRIDRSIDTATLYKYLNGIPHCKLLKANWTPPRIKKSTALVFC